MPTLHSPTLFLAAGLALNLTPGPHCHRTTGGLVIALEARFAYGPRP